LGSCGGTLNRFPIDIGGLDLGSLAPIVEDIGGFFDANAASAAPSCAWPPMAALRALATYSAPMRSVGNAPRAPLSASQASEIAVRSQCSPTGVALVPII